MYTILIITRSSTRSLINSKDAKKICSRYREWNERRRILHKLLTKTCPSASPRCLLPIERNDATSTSKTIKNICTREILRDLINFSSIVLTLLVCIAHHSLASLALEQSRIVFCCQSFLLSTSLLLLLKKRKFKFHVNIQTRIELTIILFTKASPFHIDYVLLLYRPL